MRVTYTLLSLSFFLFYSLTLLSQNNDCNDAIEPPSLNNFCGAYTMQNATYDVVNGNCVDPFDSPNVWFKFTAQGPDVVITAEGQAGPLDITIGRFVGGDCVNGNYTSLQCATEYLQQGGLTPGEEYFISINKNDLNNSNDDFTFCIDNPSVNAPPNDDPCDAIQITPNGSCSSGTTVDANQEFVGNFCSPAERYEQMVWYRVTISPGNNLLEVTMNGLTDGVLVIAEFPNGCAGNTLNILGTDCDDPYFIAVNVIEGQDYYIGVSTDAVNEGTFDVCATESGPPPGCAESDDCLNASLKIIGTPVANGSEICITDCNIGAQPDISINGCIPANWTTTYYQFTTDPLTTRVSITFEDPSGVIDAVAMALMVDCNTYIECEQGAGGVVNIVNATVQPNTTYIIAVATPQGGQGADFEVCIRGFQISDEYCIGRSADTSVAHVQVINTSLGSPPSGPFIPGEEITYEMYVSNYALTTSSQWLQAIIPVFGTGFDPSSFNPNGEPVISNGPNSAGPGTWSWYEANANDYNGNASYYSLYTDPIGRLAICYFTDPDCTGPNIQTNDGLPAGWYAFSNGSSSTCVNNGDPDYGWGDGRSGSWTVTFTLRVRDYNGPEGCVATGFIDCSVKMFTMSDEQVGCWVGAVNPNACAGDEYKVTKGINKCCIGPELIPDDITICSGSSTSIDLNSDLEEQGFDVQYTWTVQSPPTVTGAEDGSGQIIDQVLINNGSSPEVVIYTITPELIGSFCPGTPEEIEVTVLPAVIADAGPDIEGCAQGEFRIGGSPSGSGGSGNYTYLWNNGAGSEPNPTVTVNATTQFVLTVTDEYGCEATDEMIVKVSEAIVIDIEGDSTYCAENEFTELTAYARTSEAPFEYEWDGPFYSDQQTIEATEGQWVVTVTDRNGCTGTQEFNVYEKATPEIDFILSPDTDTICEDDFVDIFALVFSDGFDFDFQWQRPIGIGGTSQVETAREEGFYSVEVTDEFGCYAEDSIKINVIPYPDVNIIGDSVICEGSHTSLSTDVKYKTYQWSDGSTLDSIVVTEAGEYSVTITNAGNCVGIDTFIVEIDNSVEAIARSHYNLTCDSLSVRLDASGSTTGNDFDILWYTNDGNIVSGSTDVHPVVNSVGTYYLSITNVNTGCSAVDSVYVPIDTMIPNIDAGNELTLTCGVQTLTLNGTVPSSGSYSYLWSTINGNILSGETTLNPEVNQPGTYYFDVTSEINGCTSRDSVVVQIDEERPIAIAGEDYTLDCVNLEYTPNTTGTSTGPEFSYFWSSTNGSIVAGNTTLSPIFNIEGTYVLEVTNNVNNCAVTDTLIIDEDKVGPELSGESIYQLNCYQEDTIVHVNIDNYIASSYQYDWTLGDGTILTNADSTQFVNSEGDYSVTVTNQDNGCFSIFNIRVNKDIDTPNAIAGPDRIIDCSVSEITIDATNSSNESGYLASWSTIGGNIVSGGNSLTPIVNQGGLYILKVTNINNGCENSDTVLVEISEDYPIIDAGPDRMITCDSTQLTLIGKADNGTNFEFSWTASAGGNIVSGASTLNPLVDEAGTYTLLVKNLDNGCTATSSCTVIRNDTPPSIISLQDQVLTCRNPILNIDATGSETGDSISYLWTTTDGNIVSGENTLNITVDEAGTYLLTITNSETGCTSRVEAIITEDMRIPQVNILEPDTITCVRDEIVIDGSQSSSGNQFVYKWKTTSGRIIGSSTNNVVTVNQSGEYWLIVENTQNGCIDSSRVIVYEDVQRPQLDDIDDVTLTCADPSISLSISTREDLNDMNILWTTPDGVVLVGDVTSDEISVSSSGTVIVRLTNVITNCYIEKTINIAEDFEAPIAEAGSPQKLSCESKTLTLNGSGSSLGEEFTYEWFSNNGGNVSSGASTLTPTIDAAGLYYIRVTNTENGCSTLDSVVIDIDENLPKISIQTPEKLTCLNNRIIIDASQSSTGPSLTFTWSTTDGNIVRDENTLTPIVNQPGSYTLTIYDASNDCSAESTVLIEEDKVQPIIEMPDITTYNCYNEEVELMINVINADDYEISWWTIDGNIVSGNEDLEIVINTGGTYNVNVTNTRNGCSTKSSITIVNNTDKPILNVGDDVILNCYQSEANLTATIDTDGDDYEFEWTTDNGNIVSDIQSLNPLVDAAGIYTIEVINTENGCRSVEEIIVDIDTASIQFRLEQNGPLKCNREIVSINSIYNTNNNHSIEWRGNIDGILGDKTIPNIRVNQEGLYQMTLLNIDNGCVSESSIIVENNIDTLTDINWIVENPECIEEEYGCLVVTNTEGGQSPYTIYIDGKPQISRSVVCNIPIGDHELLIEDANGCEFTSSFTILEAPEYTIDLGPSLKVDEGDSVSLQLAGDIPLELIETINWYTPDLFNCLNCLNITFKPELSGLVTAEVIDTNGCIYRTNVYVAVIKPRRVYVPTGFTPNDDSHNDKLTVYAGPEVKMINNFRIYDRWGELVYFNENFEPNDETIGWDGRLNGKLMHPDVYVYKITVEYTDGLIEEITGELTLLR